MSRLSSRARARARARSFPAAALPLVLALAVLSTACGGDDCANLADSLASATSGDVITLGECRAEGQFVLPDGVTLQGAGATTILAGGDDGPVLSLGAGSRLASLTVESDARVGISATTPGASPQLTGVTVRATRGAAVRVEGTGATLTDVTLEGPVTVENAPMVPPDPTPSATATNGLLLVDAGTTDAPVTITGLDVRGFARFGVLATNSHVDWDGGSVSECLTVSVMARGGTFDANAVQISNALEGVQVFPAFGAIFDQSVVVTTRDVLVSGSEGYGLLHDTAMAMHERLVANDNGEPAVWAQNDTLLTLFGPGTTLGNNRLAGVVLVGSASATISDAQIDGSTMAPRIEASGTVMVGDGIHAAVTTAADLTIENVTLRGNERVGVLLDVSDAVVDGVLTNVTVDATGTANGAIAQGPSGIIASGPWDATVTRTGVAAGNDLARTDAFETVGIVMPMFLPPL